LDGRLNITEGNGSIIGELELDATSVLVELLPAGNEIELRARGPEARRS
jgi:hypothetical protein